MMLLALVYDDFAIAGAWYDVLSRKRRRPYHGRRTPDGGL